MTKIISFIKTYRAEIALSIAFIVSLIADNLFAAVIILALECVYLHIMIEIINKGK